MSKDTNSFGHDKALACESRGFVYKKKRMHRFDTPSFKPTTDKTTPCARLALSFYKIGGGST